MKLVIADPPYPPRVTVRYDRGAPRTVKRSRAQRYYGDGTRSQKERPADFHPAAAEWDAAERHRALLAELMSSADGWAIATTPDGLAAYGDLPPGAQLMAWVKLNNPATGARVRSVWEAVILYVPPCRRGRCAGAAPTSDVLVCAAPRLGFVGAKPERWTHWILDALGYDPSTDIVHDMFPGSGAVAAAVSTYVRPLEAV